jgi:hypothetical protein
MLCRAVIRDGLMVCLVLALTGGMVWAQDTDPCGPIRIPIPRPVPVMKYTMASPRACLIGPAVWATNAYWLPTGAAENFPRGHGSIRVPVGTRVVFCLSRDLEGVWYPRSYGCLGTSLTLQWCRCCIRPADVDKCPDCDPSSTNAAICPWVTIGRDGAKDVRKGPSIGRAKVGVPVRFKRPGFYYLRGIIHMFAEPYYPQPIDEWRNRLLDNPDGTDVLPRIPPAQDRDIVYVRVHVVDIPIVEVEPDDDFVDDPDVIHIKPMPKDIDPNEPLDLNADLNGDEVINFADLSVLAQQWGREYEMPFDEDE